MRFLRVLYNIYSLIVFLAFMIIILPGVFVASLFGKITGGNIIYRLCSFWADSWFLLVGIRNRLIFEASHDPNQQYIFVANHISYLDAPLIAKSIRQPVRPLGKFETGRIPLFGFIYRNAIVSVDRSSATNRARSVRVLKSILSKGISIFIFPEGTFNETGQPLKSFFDGAFRIAIETQTPIKPVLFLDSYDRMSYRHLFSITPGQSRCVFLQEIAVSGYGTRDIDALKNHVYSIMERELIRYNASWIQSGGDQRNGVYNTVAAR